MEIQRRICCVEGCGEVTARYKFPKQLHLQSMWVERVFSVSHRRNLPGSLHNYGVCGRHFHPICKMANGNLRRHAVPTLYLPYYRIPEGIKQHDATFDVPEPTEEVPTRVAAVLQEEGQGQTTLSPSKDSKVLLPVRIYGGKRRIVSTAGSTGTMDNEEASTSTVADTLSPPTEARSSTKLVGPIRMTANGENICGRCPNVSDASRNYAYEALASKLTFPCRFEGCNENIPWAKVRRHEDICLHRPYECLLKTCKWSGKVVHLCPHFKDVHKELYLKGNQSFPLDCTKDSNFFMVNCSLGKTFIFEIACASGKLQFVPYYFGYIDNPHEIIVKIKLENKDDRLSLIKEVTAISMYDRQNLNSGIPVIFDKTLGVFSTLKVVCSFQIEMNCLITDNILPMKFSKRCSCPCDKLIEFDYYLETISNDDTKIPCIHNGCDSVLRKGNIYSHTAECEYRLFKCQRDGCGKIKCIFKDLVDHYIKKHDATRHDSIFTWGWNIKHLKTKKVCICFDAVIAYDTIFDDHSKITYSDQEQIYTVTFDIKEIRLKRNNQFKFKVVLLHQSDSSKNLVMETMQQNFDDFQLSLSLKESIFSEYVNKESEFCCDVAIML